MRFKKLTLAVVMMVSLLVSSMNVLAFNPETDSSKVKNIKGTILYKDSAVSDAELNNIMSFYSLIPSTLRTLLANQGVKMYLVGSESNPQTAEYTPLTKDGLVPAGSGHPLEVDKESLGDAIDGLYFYHNEADLETPLYIEKDPYDLKNLRMVTRNGNSYLLYHGVLVRREEKDVDWDLMRHNYIEDAPYFGVDYFAKTTKAIQQELAANKNKPTGFSICATSYGPSVEYDSDNSWKFCRFVKPGYTLYYANNGSAIPQAVLHEAGHHLDWYSVPLDGYYKQTLFGISDSQDWKTLYNKYKTYLASVDSLAQANIPQGTSEGFADAFRLVYQYPDKMRSECKEVYEFVLRKVQQYSGTGTESQFDAVDYAARYTDVVQALGNDKKALYNHFITLGVNEGRVAKFN